MQRFEKLLIWQKAHQLTLDVYRMARLLPPEERFGLASHAELRYQMILLRDLKVLRADQWQEIDRQTNEVGQILNGLVDRLTRNA